VILVYHAIVERIRDSELEEYVIGARTFQAHLDYLARHGAVVAASVIAETLREGRAPDPRWVAITLDDGLLNQTRLGREILAERKLPWSLAVSPGLLETGRTIWSYQLAHLLLRRWRRPSIPRPDAGGGAWPTRTREERRTALRGIRTWVFGQALPAECEAYLDRLADMSRSDDPSPIEDGGDVFQMASLRDVDLCVDAGAEILGHGWSHFPLSSRLSPACLEREIEGVACWLRARNPSGPRGFVLPHGISDPPVLERIRKSFDFCLTSTPARISARTNPAAMPRVSGEYPLGSLRRFIARLPESSAAPADAALSPETPSIPHPDRTP